MKSYLAIMKRTSSFLAEAVLCSYSQVLFAKSPWLGLLLMAATFVVPEVGAVGLAGVLFAVSIVALLKFDRESLRSGVLGYNSLLLFLALGATMERSGAFWVIALAAALLVVVVQVALGGALYYHLRLPILSLPFVFVAWLVTATAPQLRGVKLHDHPPALDLGSLPGMELLDTFLRSLGAIFFQPHWLAGLLVLVALVIYSRIATVHALLGFAVAVVADQWLFTFPADFVHLYVGFNFILTAVAIGGIFYVPSPASLGLAGAASLACGVVSMGLVSWLEPVGMSVLALPFNVTVLILLYAMRQRALDATPRSADVLGLSPEENLEHYCTRVERFHTSLPVPLQLPFLGTWTCTQGNDREPTHLGLWRHGLDFEVVDEEGRRHRNQGQRKEDWLCWRLPVLAMAAGTVVKVVNGLADNEVGEVDTKNNWGNLVIVQHAPDLFSMVAHLAANSIRVAEGDEVKVGQTLGLCGSSGRSPVPHLHLQVQATPLVGHPTRAIVLHGIVVDGKDHKLEHLPVEGEKVRNISRCDELAGAMSFTSGQRYRLRTVVDGRELGVDEVISDIDLLGNKSLWCPARRSRLWFENRGDAFVVYD
ncbi:MAG: peptidoglycan DD-metalloendopeptidase family protein, partial [Proteobacteria bacterium]|nr:peptidoglycan DD-metalloendopeptidase family protein [Pseudomonadota bacterium]